jgi:DNA-binding CsgD family transcriptional regulator/integrase
VHRALDFVGSSDGRDHDMFSERGITTMTDLVSGHLRQLAEAGGRSASTTRSYESYARKWIEPRIGSMAVGSVRRSDIDAVTAAMVAARRAASSINHVKALLRGSFERARSLGLIEASPMETVAGGAQATPTAATPAPFANHEPRPAPDSPQLLDEALLARLLDASKNHAMTNLALRLTLALRVSRRELVALQWSDIDLEARTVQTLSARDPVALDLTTAQLLELVRQGCQDDGKWVLSSDGGITAWTAGHLSNRFALVRSRVPQAHSVRLGDLTRAPRMIPVTRPTPEMHLLPIAPAPTAKIGPVQLSAKPLSVTQPPVSACPSCNRPWVTPDRDDTARSMRPSAVELRRFLTHGEDAVALLAAQGLTNSAIASRLFVSVKAVEFHLTHVFQKLGILNRTQLSLLFGSGPFEPGK